MSDYLDFDEIPHPQGRLDELLMQIDERPRRVALELLVDRLTDPYPPLRHRAGEELGLRLDDDVLALLHGLLRRSRDEAVGAAERLELDPTLVPDPDEAHVRHAACLALQFARDAESIDVLAEATTDEASDVRYQALVALHEIQPSLERLRSLLPDRLDDDDPEVATVAAQIAAETGWVEATEPIADVWESSDTRDRLPFALALAELVGDYGAELDGRRSDALVDQLTDALEDERTVAAASRGLVMLGTERARQPLSELLDRWFVHPLLRLEAAAALVELDDERGRTHLADALDHRRRDVRGYALRTVGRLRLDAHFDRLADTALSDDYHADTALLALGEWGGEAVEPLLEEAAERHPDDELRRLADDILERLRSPKDFDPDAFWTGME